ncbi:MAG TPA: VCBS repeat-containing protein [Thermodesulfovibrionales bacterium]|nr:VCBS repeat-containing protein [Thermodesulfovibrionales bacterium]
MKRIAAFVFILFMSVSCARQPEVKPMPKETVIPQPPAPQALPAEKKYLQTVMCEENTSDVFNKSGMEVLPFVRITFFDVDRDGQQELIAGGKDGALRLYKRRDSGKYRTWVAVPGYFDGVRVGAFASPAMGDLDSDGKPELVVGTGGFSSESGRVIVFRNTGNLQKPLWTKVDMPNIDVGDDAAPALADVNGDGKPDLVVGNSTGALVLYRNTTRSGSISFAKDNDYFRGISVGMYGMPAAMVADGKVIIIAGNSMGKVYEFERAQNGTSGWHRTTLGITFSSFAAPTFLQDSSDALPGLVVSDGNGQIHYFRNGGAGFRAWDESFTFFAGRIMPGPACTPSLGDMNGRSCLVTGNINGELKFFEFRPYAEILPWAERPDFFRGIKLSGFSKGIMTVWDGRDLLITGQQDGFIRAFVNAGNADRPSWKERKDFFKGVPKTFHASPTVFDLDGDGHWELIVGDVDGNVSAYRMRSPGTADPTWEKIGNVFANVHVDRYAAPALIRDADKIYLFVGAQDGSMNLYTARSGPKPVFEKDALFNGIQVNNHSSPSASLINGIIEMSVGDYNGNLRHFACKKANVEVHDR